MQQKEQTKILSLKNNQNLSKKLKNNAFKKVKNFTWDNRAERIIEYV